MRSQPLAQGATSHELLPSIFAGLFGAFLGLALLKFGNPPITEKWVTAPANYWEFLLGYPWPIAWAYWLLVLIGVAGIAVARWKSPAPSWLVALPLLWLIWQLIAGTRSVDVELTRLTLWHFAACVLSFYLGYFSLSRVRRGWLFWLGLLCGFVLVLSSGWGQQFGGLKESRRSFFLYIYPYMKEVPPEYLKKISSNRIFSTLFYPNTLAGALLLLLPAMLAVAWQSRTWLPGFWRLFLAGSVVLTDLACLYVFGFSAGGLLILLLGLLALLPGPRWLLPACVAIAALACLYWSGSKGGWLLMLLTGLIGLLRLPWGKQFKLAMLTAVLVAGLAGFLCKHATFFQKGATSVSARFDYWRAAAQTTKDNPLFGTGPGTFAIAYQKIKRPESEMSRLVHNDYLEQASDSGVPGLLAYALFIVSMVVWSFPKAGKAAATRSDDWLVFSAWLGVLGWSLQSLVEFGLYIPALAWPAFTLLGWFLGRKEPEIPGTQGAVTSREVLGNPLDKVRQSR